MTPSPTGLGVSRVTPARSPTAGGGRVMISGDGFVNDMQVLIGGRPATGIVVGGAHAVSVVVPAGDAGAADVMVQIAGGATATLHTGLTYADSSAPSTSLASGTPGSGPATGGTVAVISGANFVAGAVVLAGGRPADLVTVLDAATISARFPAIPEGPAELAVTNPDGQSGYLSGAFSAVPAAAAAPHVTGVTPQSGAVEGGNAVIVTGTGFAAGAHVFVAGKPAASSSAGPNALAVIVPAAQEAGNADIAVTNPDGQSDVLPGGYVYFNAPPVLTSVAPTCGAATGGTPIVITGRSLRAGVSATIGGLPLTGLVRNDSNTLSGTSAAHAAGAADVVVTNPDGQSDQISGGFFFTDATHPCQSVNTGQLALRRVIPSSGPLTGGTVVTLIGDAFASGISVKFGNVSATDVHVFGTSSLTATAPASSAVGPVDVTVSLQGASSTLRAAFDYFDATSNLPAPSIAQVSPNAGPNTGGSVVLITGASFASGARVFFGATEASLPTLVDDGHLVAVAPASTPGAVDVTVTNRDGKSATMSLAFAYYPAGAAGAAPLVQRVDPRTGSTLQATQVAIAGSGFQPGALAFFGGVPAANISLQPDGTLAATVAAQAPGTVDVVVTNPDGQSSTLAQGFTFSAPPPQLAAIQPAFAPIAGGTTAVVTGSGFLAGDVVALGGTAAATQVVDATAMFVAVPAHDAGIVDVTLLRGGAIAATLAAGFEYRANYVPSPAPTVAALEPATGPASGGTVLWLSGTNFAPGMQVFFGANAAVKVTLSDPSHAVVIAPPGAAGFVDVNLINPDGQAGALLRGFSYVSDALLSGFAPVLSAVTPDHGPESTDTVDILSGHNFVAGEYVFVGAARGAGVRLLSSSIIDATFPHQPAGTVDVAVTHPDGRSSVLAHAFTFQARPTLVSIAASAGGSASGTTLGGTAVTIAGTGFQPGATVTFGGHPATSVVVASASIITAVTPAGAAGLADVLLTNPDGQQATLAGGWLYIPPPGATAIWPAVGPAAGGTIAIVSGQNFDAHAVAYVAGSPVETVFGSPTSLAITMPPGSGTVDVIVKNSDAQSATLSAAFTYTAPSSAPPTLTSIAPATGPTTGASFVTVSGTNFAQGSRVILGGAALARGLVVTPAVFTGLTPPHAAGAARVAVTTPDGQSARLDGGFAYVDPAQLGAPPVVTNTLPSSLPAAPGGQSLAIVGSGFVSGASVYVQGRPAAATGMTASSITVAAPAGTPGAADIAVTNPDGQTAIATGLFSYTVPPPQLDGTTPLTPARGPTSGHTAVAIKGSYFLPPVQVFFANSAATIVSANDHEIDVLTPAGVNGPAAVYVVNRDGQQSQVLAGGFYYNAPPQIAQVSPTSGKPAGGDQVAILGNYFSGNASTIHVTFGGSAAPIVGTPTSSVITVTTPPAPGSGSQAVAVSVTNDDGQSTTLAGGFVYLQPAQPPVVSGVTPNTGALAGGYTVTVLGQNFQAGATVKFGPDLNTLTASQGALVTSPGAITVLVPAASSAGVVLIQVVNPDGQHGELSGAFTYVAGPPPAVLAINFITPQQGDAAGGTRVLVGGTGFVQGAAVTLLAHDGSACPSPAACALVNVQVLGPTAIAGTMPPQPLATVANYDVKVQQPGGLVVLPNAWQYGTGRRRWTPVGLRMPMESHNGKDARGLSGAYTPAWTGVIGNFTQQSATTADVWIGGGSGRMPRLYQGSVETAGARQRIFTDFSRNQRNPDGSQMADNCCGSGNPGNYNYRPFKPQAFDLDGNGWPDVAFWNDDRNTFTIEWNDHGVLQAREYGSPYGNVSPSDWVGGYDARGNLIDLNLDGYPDFVFTDGGGRRNYVMLSCGAGTAAPYCTTGYAAYLNTGIAAGPQTITNGMLYNLGPQDFRQFLVAGQTKLMVDLGPSYEVVTVTAVTQTSFTATFQNAHGSGTPFANVIDVTSSTSVTANSDAAVHLSSFEGIGLSYNTTLVVEPGTPNEERVSTNNSPDYGNGVQTFHFAKAHTAPFRMTSKDAHSFVADATRFPANANDVTYSAVAGDIDGDGDVDVITGTDQQGIKVWINNAAFLRTSGADPNTFSFTLSTASTFAGGVTSGNVRALALVDFNGDLLPDLLVGYNGNAQERLFMNQGSGVFADETVAAAKNGCAGGASGPRLPVNPQLNDSIVRYDIRDFNGDGAADVLAWIQVNGTPGSFQKPLRLWLNDGKGCFIASGNIPNTRTMTDVLFGGNALTWDYALGDFNGDFYPDMIAAFEGVQTRQYVNNGQPQFLDKTMSNFAATDTNHWWRWTRGSMLVDLNGDGYPDLVTSQVNWDPNLAPNYGGCGGGQHQCYLPLDGSGIHAYLNDGAGNYPHDDTLTVFPTGVDPTTNSVVSTLPIASWAMDNAPHLWNSPGAPQVLLVSSATDYNYTGTPPVLKGTVFDAPTGSMRLLMANGNGTFSDGTYPRLPVGKGFGYTSAVKFVDLDGDGNVDIVVGDAVNGTIQVWQNSGNGYFADVTSTAVVPGGQLGNPCGQNRVNQLVVANFDQDNLNRPDLLVVRDCQSRLLINRSDAVSGIRLVDESTCDGTYCTTPRLPNPPPGAYSAVVANLDCVGGPDLFLLQSDGNGSPRVLLNSVTCTGGNCGYFTDVSNTYLQNVSACIGTDCGGNVKAVGLSYDTANTDIFIARYSGDGQVRPHRLLKNTCGPMSELTVAQWQPVPTDDDKIVDLAVGSLFVNNNDPNAKLVPDLLLTGYFATRIYQNTP